MKRAATNFFICSLLFLFVVDSIPETSSFHKRLKVWSDPVLDVTGLWQNTWALFAPNSAKRNARVSVTVSDGKGRPRTWYSPNFPELSILDRFTAFRAGEFFETIRNDHASGAWPSVADYFRRTECPTATTSDEISVQLIRHWWDVPAPNSGQAKPDERAYTFYEEGPSQ